VKIVPLLVGELEIVQNRNSPGDSAVSTLLAAEQNRACIAGAGKLPIGWREEVLMRVANLGSAEIASLAWNARTSETLKRGYSAGEIRRRDRLIGR